MTTIDKMYQDIKESGKWKNMKTRLSLRFCDDVHRQEVWRKIGTDEVLIIDIMKFEDDPYGWGERVLGIIDADVNR